MFILGKDVYWKLCLFLDVFLWTYCAGTMWETFKDTFDYTWIYTWVWFNAYICEYVILMYFQLVFFVSSIVGDVNV